MKPKWNVCNDSSNLVSNLFKETNILEALQQAENLEKIECIFRCYIYFQMLYLSFFFSIYTFNIFKCTNCWRRTVCIQKQSMNDNARTWRKSRDSVDCLKSLHWFWIFMIYTVFFFFGKQLHHPIISSSSSTAVQI